MSTNLLRKVDAGMGLVSVAVPETLPLLVAGDRLRARLRQGDTQAGLGTIELLVIAGLVIALALGAFTIIRQKVTAKSNQLDLG